MLPVKPLFSNSLNNRAKVMLTAIENSIRVSRSYSALIRFRNEKLVGMVPLRVFCSKSLAQSMRKTYYAKVRLTSELK